MINSNTMTDNSKDAEDTDFLVQIVSTGCDIEEVLAENTPYSPGAEFRPNNDGQLRSTFLKMFQTVERASAHFTTGASNAYEHITRQHVRDIMEAYGKHLKANDNASTTFGEEYQRILRNVALTMKSWK
jgi:hypothetical protein